jgi:hypothetical protein
MSANSPIPEHELPNWMKQAQRGVDWGALLVLAFSFLAAWSFISQSQITASNENEHFVFQAKDIAAAMREGIFYPRWSPYAIKGYGAPIPHYYPQGASYLVALIDVFFTNDGVLALRFLYILAFPIAGASIYSLVNQRSNALVAVFAAIAYLYNPYLGLSVPYLLGDLALFLGLALIPLLLWIINRLLLREQAMDVFVMAVITAIFILSIPRLLPQAIILALLLIGLHNLEIQARHKLIWIAGGFLLGLGLSSFFWLPALLEGNLVRWFPPAIAAEPQRLRLAELFSLPAFLDSGFLSNENYFSLGWGLALLALLSTLGLALEKQFLSFHGAFLLYGFAVLGLLLAFPQQTELLVSISLCFAIGGSYAVNFLKHRFRRALLWLLLVLLVGLSFPHWKIPNPAMPITETDAAAQIRYENAGYGIAVLPSGMAIPSNVAPTIESPFTDAEISANRSPDSAALSLREEQDYRGIYQVISNTESQAIYQRAYFFGWEAYLNNQPIPLSSTENGLIHLDIPAANAELIISLGESWVRIIAWILTISALVSGILIWWSRWRRIPSDYDTSPLLSRLETRLVLSALIFMTGLHLIPEASYYPQPRYSLLEALYVRNEVAANFQLLAYDLPEETLTAGQTLRVQLYWEVSRPILEQYQVRLRLISLADNTPILRTNYSHPSYIPTNRWLRGFVLPQTYEFDLPANLPTGEYALTIDAYRCEEICGEIGNATPTVELRFSPVLHLE